MKNIVGRGRLSCLALLFAVAMAAGCSKQASAPAGPEATSTSAPAPAAAAPAPAAVKREFQKLIGKWERPDGGYVLEIKKAEADGTLEAAYFNPGPIHVAKAVALKKDGATQMYVLLQDVNYPGCTYTLTYDSQADQLYGQYFQAAVNQTYNITFARLKE